MRHFRLISFLAVASAAGAAIVACSLQDGGLLEAHEYDAAAVDAATDVEAPIDSGPDVDAAIFDAGATFCDLTLHDGGFFFCADFDDVSPTHGFTEIVTDGGSLVFGPSDASAPNLFESTLTSPNNDSSQNALLSLPFDFPDSGDAGISYLSIALDFRVNSLSIDGSAPQVPSANAFVLFLDPLYAIYLPIVGRVSGAPVSAFGTVDFNDASVGLTNIGDGGTPVGEWNRIRLQVEVGTDGGASTLSVFVNTVMVASQPVSLSPGVLTSRRMQLLLGPGGKGPFATQFDYDNVVIRSDKF